MNKITEEVPTTNFLISTYNMVSAPSTNKHIRWNKDGTVACIADPHEFARVVLPMYFKHNRHSSFVRQLNIYGFMHYIVDDVTYFSHPAFVRDNPQLLSTIVRKNPNARPSPQPTDDDSAPLCTLVPTFEEYAAAEGLFVAFRQALGMSREDFVNVRDVDAIVENWKRAAAILRSVDDTYVRAAVPTTAYMSECE